MAKSEQSHLPNSSAETANEGAPNLVSAGASGALSGGTPAPTIAGSFSGGAPAQAAAITSGGISVKVANFMPTSYLTMTLVSVKQEDLTKIKEGLNDAIAVKFNILVQYAIAAIMGAFFTLPITLLASNPIILPNNAPYRYMLSTVMVAMTIMYMFMGNKCYYELINIRLKNILANFPDIEHGLTEAKFTITTGSL